MPSDHIRDYATGAFMFWAAVGGLDAYKRKLRSEVMVRLNRVAEGGGGGIAKPVEAWQLEQERALEERKAELADLEAVEKVLHVLESTPSGADARKALDLVYFDSPGRELCKGDIEARVIRAMMALPSSRMTVYRHLRGARLLFAKIRNLRAG